MPTSTARRRLVGLALRDYRQKVGCEMAVAAHILGCDISKVSRIETGQRSINSKDLTKLLTAYGVGDEQQDLLLSLNGSKLSAPAAWWRGYTDVLSGTDLEYLAAEDMASQVLSYSPCLIPTLLQSEDYTLALAVADQQVPPGLEAQFAEAIQARQQAVLASGQTNVAVVIGEAALRQQFGDAHLMREQLRKILELTADASWITVQVLPFSAGPSGIIGCCSLSILRFPAVPTLGMVHLAGPNGGLCLEQSQDVSAYIHAFHRTQAAALSPAESRGLVEQVAAEYTSTGI